MLVILLRQRNTMLQISKILHSRDEWKNKAIERSAEIREFRKTQKRHLEKIAALKLCNSGTERLIEAQKKPLIPLTYKQ